jgi:hypothetical protein
MPSCNMCCCFTTLQVKCCCFFSYEQHSHIVNCVTRKPHKNLACQSLQIYCNFWQHATVTREGQRNLVICPSDGKSLTVVYVTLMTLEPRSQKEEVMS